MYVHYTYVICVYSIHTSQTPGFFLPVLPVVRLRWFLWCARVFMTLNCVRLFAQRERPVSPSLERRAVLAPAGPSVPQGQGQGHAGQTGA